MIISRELHTDPVITLARIQNEWIRIWRGVYLRELGWDPSLIATRLRELAEDPNVLARLAELVKEEK